MKEKKFMPYLTNFLIIISLMAISKIKAREDGVIRITCVGDSITDGIGASNDDNTYPAWSLSALLGLIPAGRALYHDVINNKYVFTGNTRSGLYKDPIDAAFEVVCSLLGDKDKNDE